MLTWMASPQGAGGPEGGECSLPKRSGKRRHWTSDTSCPLGGLSQYLHISLPQISPCSVITTLGG